MRKSVVDYLFDRDFNEKISRDSLPEYRKYNEEGDQKGTASLISYVLKFKKKKVIASSIPTESFSLIKNQSLELYRNRNRSVRFNFSRIAVAASLVVAALFAYWAGSQQWFSGFAGESKVIEFSTPEGQQSELILPDGTFVALNYGSTLKYHVSGNKAKQQVELNGEAFFKVAKNKSRTFKVVTEKMSVNVLGTEFNVKAYSQDRSCETTLLEGSIEINDLPGSRESIRMVPGQKWSYHKATKSQQLISVDPQLSTSWRNGEYYFEKVSLKELANALERMYKVDIYFQDSSLENEVYSGVVFKSENISSVFQIINLTLPLSVQIDGDQIQIRRK